MKTKLIQVLGIIIMLLFTNSKLYSQITTLNTFGGATGDFAGWSQGSSLNLDIVNEDAFPINFYTNGGAGSGGMWNNLRMFIEGNTGRVGIGNFAIANTILHVHESAANTEAEISISNNVTGNTALDGFRIGSFADNSVLFRLYEDARIDFGTDITSINNNIPFQLI